MPKRPTRPAANERQKKQSADGRPAAKQLWEEAAQIVRSERFHYAAGFALACLMLYCLVSYISFFVHGFRDFSELGGQGIADNIRNLGGSIGAGMQHFFVNELFGLPVIAIIIMFTLYALSMLRVVVLNHWKVFFHTFFWLVWGSCFLAFIQHIFHISSFFLWGGGHGAAFCNWLIPKIQWLGVALILLATLLTYCVAVSRETIPFIHRACSWCKQRLARFHKHHEPQVETISTTTDDGTLVTITNAAEDTEITTDKEEEFGNEVIFEDLLTTKVQQNDQLAPEDEFTIIEGKEEEMVDHMIQTVDPEAQDDPSEEETKHQVVDELAIQSVTTETIDKNNPDEWLRQAGPYDPRKDLENYRFPSLDLLKVYDNENTPIINEEEQRANANRIVETLKNYGVDIVKISATVGPTVTLYEVVPKAGVKISRIQSLEADIMMSLAAKGIRIIAPMPGKGTVGIEVPNASPQTVSMHSVIASKRFQEEKKMKLPIALGRTITNDIFMFDLAKTPHLLVAGATGQGKSVAINAIITSLLYKKHPAEMKLVMVDPKMVEFAPYKPLIRHYLAAMPDTEENDIIITDCMKVIDTLNSLVIEMEDRYKLLMDAGVRNLDEYNDKFKNRRLNPEKLVDGHLHHQFLPFIVIVIDEYGDFIMQAGKQVEMPIARITQKARAVGMHMILATQRPSVNIVTGLIKANIPTRIALRTQSLIDSRTVLDTKGAEQLIGRGDLLYSGSGDITRVQCAFVDTPEVDEIVEHIQHQQRYSGPYELPEYVGEGGSDEAAAPGSVDLKKLDSMFAEVARYVVMNQQGSTSVLQRRFEIGYNRAGKLSDQLEAAGIVGPAKGSKGRDVLIQDEAQLQEVFRR
ncbi:MAG: DNA translocase FtsK, partial [Paludibacteraceae bacterium]|nr:DNA translocase FtsK [Paludibacteraceae bacterium]